MARPEKAMDRILLDKVTIERCRKFGRDMVEKYKGIDFVTYFGMERDPVGLALARMAECVACLFFGVSIEHLNWRIYRTGDDGGVDLYVWGIGAIDVKWTRHYHGCLVWPCIPEGNNDKLKLKKFSVFVLVVGLPDFGFDVVGWKTRLGFLAEKKVARLGDPRFREGTWYMEQVDINPMGSLTCKQLRSS